MSYIPPPGRRDDKIPHKGDIVKCNYDFSHERNMYKHNYPFEKEYYTVKDSLKKTDTGDYYIFLEECTLPFPLAAGRFDIIQTMYQGDVVLKQAFKIANNL